MGGGGRCTDLCFFEDDSVCNATNTSPVDCIKTAIFVVKICNGNANLQRNRIICNGTTCPISRHRRQELQIFCLTPSEISQSKRNQTSKIPSACKGFISAGIIFFFIPSLTVFLVGLNSRLDFSENISTLFQSV